MSNDVPLPPTARTFVAKPSYRPPGSFRAFYVSPSWLSGEAPVGGVIAIKGMEPAAGDFAAALHDLRQPCYSPHNIAEHLVFEERKIPGAVTVSEARREAERATVVQSGHWRHYGRLARLPLPLFVFRHAAETEARTIEALRRELSEPALAVIEPALAGGLGVYAYYYPAPPVRVRDVETMLAGLDFRQRMFALMSACEPGDVVRRWISTFVRILHLGMLPGTLASLRTGVCCQPQNACLDGGFVDLDSLTPFNAMPDDAAVYAGLHMSTDSLVDTVRALITGSHDPTRAEGSPGRFDCRFVEQYVLGAIDEALATESRPTLTLDPRARTYFSRQQSFEALVDGLSAYYPPAAPGFSQDVQRFGEFGFALFRAACRPLLDS